jgi:hypothetical protein
MDDMGEMKRAIAYEERQRRRQERFASPLVVSACIIAAVRLAREPDIRNSPRLNGVISESIELARMILGRIVH